MVALRSGVVLLLFTACISGVFSMPDGAPPEACADLIPRGPHGPDSSMNGPGDGRFTPYSVSFRPQVEFELSDNIRGYFYTPGQTYTVTLHSFSGATFQGFLIQLYRERDNMIVGGQLTANQNSTIIKPHACDPSTGGFTHTNRNVKNRIEFQWTPLTGTGFVFFRYTVVQSLNVHYDAFHSAFLVENKQVCRNSTILGPATISWTTTRTHVTFTIQAPSMNGNYIALGFSNNRMMTDSDIIVGAVDQAISFVDDRWATNRSMPLPDSQQDLTDTSASLANGNITVSFTRLLRTNDTTRDITLTSNRNNCVYFLLARGTVANAATRTINQHSAMDRYISMERVCLCSGAGTMTGISLLWMLVLIAVVVQYTT